MRRLWYVLTAAVVLIVLTGGGYLAHRHSAATDNSAAAEIPHLSSVELALQGEPGADPSASTPTSAGASASPGASASASPTRTATPKATGTKTTAPAAASSVVNELLAQINDLRAQNGLPAYTLLSGLNASAHKHNLTMAAGCGLSHQCPNEPSFDKRISAEGVKWSSCGENIGYSGPHANTSAELIKAGKGLTTSMYNETPPNDGHRRNLLSTSFHHVGIDVLRSSDGKIWLTQDFSS